LRIRENEGKPGMSDAVFIARFLPRYPEWRERPGVADSSALFEIARALGLADHIEMLSDYDEILGEHRAGRSVLVSTKRVPEQRESGLAARPYVMLIAAMDAECFTVWCPYPSGQSDNLPPAARHWWNRWGATGLVLHPVTTGSVPCPAVGVSSPISSSDGRCDL
jgi:hypothetical protein